LHTGGKKLFVFKKPQLTYWLFCEEKGKVSLTKDEQINLPALGKNICEAKSAQQLFLATKPFRIMSEAKQNPK
jgi:hypothetical protein